LKSRLSVTHVAIAPVVGGQQPAAGLRLLPHVSRLALSSPSPSPSPSLPYLPFPPSRRGSLSSASALTRTPCEHVDADAR
jgi:hypothetical protein